MFDEVIGFLKRVIHSATHILHLLHVEKEDLTFVVRVDTMGSLYKFLVDYWPQLLVDKPKGREKNKGN